MTSPVRSGGTSVETLSSGAGLALLSALLFGASTPLAKLLLRGIDPWMLAGLLHLGSGLGLLTVTALARALGLGTRSEAAVRGRAWLWLLLATLFGGVAGPVLLMFGLARTAATTAALLLNLEGVLTALLAWFVFRENFDRRIALGMAAIVAGGIVLTRTGAYFSLAPFFGGLIAVVVLREPVTAQIVAAGILMALGVWLHLTERHEHEHSHAGMAHEHRHVHDEHHQHAHDGTEPPGEPHSHWHVHGGLRHSHPHFPDIHHRHEHP